MMMRLMPMRKQKKGKQGKLLRDLAIVFFKKDITFYESLEFRLKEFSVTFEEIKKNK